MAVYKGSYYFNTYKGRFIYLYFPHIIERMFRLILKAVMRR